MTPRSITLNRWLIGVATIGCFVASAIVAILAPSELFWWGGLLRAGVVLGLCGRACRRRLAQQRGPTSPRGPQRCSAARCCWRSCARKSASPPSSCCSSYDISSRRSGRGGDEGLSFSPRQGRKTVAHGVSRGDGQRRQSPGRGERRLAPWASGRANVKYLPLEASRCPSLRSPCLPPPVSRSPPVSDSCSAAP